MNTFKPRRGTFYSFTALVLTRRTRGQARYITTNVGKYTIWPVNMALAEARIQQRAGEISSTAQPSSGAPKRALWSTVTGSGSRNALWAMPRTQRGICRWTLGKRYPE